MVAINANQSTFARAKVQQFLFTEKFTTTFDFILSALKRKVLFIINPISGGRRKDNFPDLLSRNLDQRKFEPEYIYTEYRGHARVIAERAVEEGIDIVAAVGGDGTINEIASAVESTRSALAIIPWGSGNGLARFLNIPLKTSAALKNLNRTTVQLIDTAIFNEKKFFNMAGIGFDAHISAHFAKNKTRGFGGYIKATLREIALYRSQLYKIDIDGVEIERKAFMVSFANSSQFGNNAYVAPKASVKDGVLDVCIIKPFPLYYFPVIVYHMFRKTAHRSRYVEIIQGKAIKVERETPGAVHLDGEPEMMGREFTVEIRPLSLAVMA